MYQRNIFFSYFLLYYLFLQYVSDRCFKETQMALQSSQTVCRRR